MATETYRDRRRVEAWSGVVTTNVIPDGQFRWYDGVTGYQSSEIIELVGDGSTTIASLLKRQPMTDGAQTIYGNKTFDGSVTAAVIPPVGFTFVQYPFDSTPLTLYGGGTWVNISEKAKAYELSASGWVSREDVGQTLYTETDYEATDTISGSPSGTYDGETVSTVFTFTGQTFRFEGGDAGTFEEGTQLDAFQGHRHEFTYGTGGSTDVYTAKTDITSTSDSSWVLDPITDGTNGTPRTDDETRMTNFTVRAWKRTA